MLQYKQIFIAVAGCLVLAIASPVAGQVGVGVEVAVQQKPQAVGGLRGIGNAPHETNNPQHMATFVQLLVQRMKVTCDLDDAQVKKILLAGKIVGRKLFSNLKRQEKFTAGLAHGNDESMKVDGDSLSDEDSETQPAQAQGMTIKWTVPVALESVTNSATWKKTLNSVLSKQQQQKWQAYLNQHRSQLRKSAVQSRVAELDRWLYLLPEQIDSVTALVDQIEGDELVKQLGNDSSLASMINLQAGTQASIGVDDLRSVLTETQLEVWRLRDEGDAVDGVFGQTAGADQTNAGSGITFKGGRGLLVKRVDSGSLGEKLGIRPGDVIDTVEGNPVDSPTQFQTALDRAGQSIAVTVIRDNAEIYLEKK